MNKIIAVVGPTASGKTNLAINIAKYVGGEIISCDSMQIYKGMSIGTAKPNDFELSQVPHHLIGVVDTDKNFSSADYVAMADEKIEELKKRCVIPVVAGGTGLYARSLLYGINFDENSKDDNLRDELTKRANRGEIQELYNQLTELDLEATEKIHMNNHIRVIRALEYCLVTGKKFSNQSVIDYSHPKYEFLMIGIGYKDRDVLYNRINKRVDIMIDEGLEEEARNFFLTHNPKSTAVQAIGYKELFPYFQNEITLEESLENIKKETRHYAKRQLTWFKKEKNITWVYPDEFDNQEDFIASTLKIVDSFLNK